MAKIPASRANLEAQLEEQLEFLQRSCDAYDAGHKAEAKRMAVALRILFHDTSSSHSLLGQLGMLGSPFFDTHTPPVGNSLVPEATLTATHIGSSGVEYVAPLDTATSSTATYDEWWGGVIFKLTNGSEVSRKSLVRTAANQDGGAHVDPSLDELYHKLVHENGLGGTKVEGGAPEAPMGDPTKAALRQIAHEALKTLIPGYGKSFEPSGMMVANVSVTLEPPEHIKKIHYQGPNGTKTPPTDPCPCGSGAPYKGCHDKS